MIYDVTIRIMGGGLDADACRLAIQERLDGLGDAVCVAVEPYKPEQMEIEEGAG